MARRFQSLLLDHVDIRTPSLRIRRLAVHRHLPDLAAVDPHRHPWSQALLYLDGEGWQTLIRDRVRIEPGSLILIPQGVPHGFARLGNKAPLCLAVDFRLFAARGRAASVSALSPSEVAQLRQNLAQLQRLQAAVDGSPSCECDLAVVQITVGLLRSAGWLPRELPAAAGRPGRPGQAIGNLLAGMDLAGPLAEVIRKSGYQRDYLNHLLKRETGLTLGQHRAQRRLALAKRLLAEGLRISHVADSVGLPDQSYFARWFRRQTGRPPTAW